MVGGRRGQWSRPTRPRPGLRELLSLERVAVVGCSGTPGKATHEIPAYLQRHGYDVYPVNPYADEMVGARRSTRSRTSTRIDLVNVFRSSDEVPGVVGGAIARGESRGDVRAVWLQSSIVHDEAAARAEVAGLDVV